MSVCLRSKSACIFTLTTARAQCNLAVRRQTPSLNLAPWPSFTLLIGGRGRAKSVHPPRWGRATLSRHLLRLHLPGRHLRLHSKLVREKQNEGGGADGPRVAAQENRTRAHLSAGLGDGLAVLRPALCTKQRHHPLVALGETRASFGHAASSQNTA